MIAVLIALARPELVSTRVFIGRALTEDSVPDEMLRLPESIPAEALPPCAIRPLRHGLARRARPPGRRVEEAGPAQDAR